MEVYYESLCQGSQDFILNYLTDIYQDEEISKIVNITLIPYGNAITIARNPPSFVCQNGDVECRGNYIAACAIHLYPNDYLPFITCVEQSLKYTTSDVNRCARLNGLSGSAINNCAESDDALYYHLHYGDITPTHQYVPWIVINNECIGEAVSRAKEVICDAYLGPRPSTCPTKPIPPKVEVKIYYESYDEDSMEYLMNYVSDLFKNKELRDITTFKFVAYGKAITRSKEPIDITCPYGYVECSMNIAHMCVAKYLYDNFYTMLWCLNNHTPSTDRLKYCATLSQLPYTDVVKCYSSEEGWELLLAAGIDTPSFVDFPYVTVANSYLRNIYTLKDAICNTYTGQLPFTCYES